MDMEGLSMICAGLGTVEEDENGNRVGYSKGEYCLDNLKDLLRFLRRDDPQNRDVFKQVCKWNIVAKDLIPIIEHCQQDRNLVLNSVKVLVFLTMPVEPTSTDISQQLEYLWRLKSSITCSDIVAVIVSFLESPLENLESEAFTEDDWKLMQLVLTLVRNILAIQEISSQQKCGESASQFLSLRDSFLELLFHENVMDIILVANQHVRGSGGYLRQDNLLLLEIFHYIFMGQDSELIVRAELNRLKVDEGSQVSLNSLKSIMEEEEERRRLCRLNNLRRHSQFSGTFTRLTMDGSKAVFKGNPKAASHNKLLKPHKVCRGAVKKIAWDHRRLPSTKDKILELLHGFVNQFLFGGYNVLMQSICEDVEKEHHAIQRSDIVVFFQVAEFVTSFQYQKCLASKPNGEGDTSEICGDKDDDNTSFTGEICGPIAASMNESMFQLVMSKWRNAFDGLKETNDYTFLSAVGSLTKNMILMLDLVLKLFQEDSKEPQTARILLYKLFYDQTDEGMTPFLFNQIKMFNTHKQPKSDLADLVEIVHKVVKLMENLQARGTLRVSRKSRKVKKKKLSQGTESENKPIGDHASIQNEVGISSVEQLAHTQLAEMELPSNTHSSGEEDNIVPAQIDECELLVQGEMNSECSLPPKEKGNSDHGNEDLWHSIGDSSGDEQLTATDEVDFKISTLVSAFANNSVIQKLCWLLKFYRSNSPTTNHYIICILRRINDDLGLHPMLYQLSLLGIFYGILAEQKSCPSKEYAEIVDFLTNLVRKMLKKMKNQPLLFVEILFWKTRKECHYINAEYMLHELGHLKKESKKWEATEGDGDISFSPANVWTKRSIADALGEDEADVVIAHDLGHQNIREKFDDGKEGITSGSDAKNDDNHNDDDREQSMEHQSERLPRRKKRLALGGELEIQIRELYDKFKNDRHCNRLISQELDPDGKISAAQISNKLKQLGLRVASRKKMNHVDEPFTSDSNQFQEGVSFQRATGLQKSIELEGSLVGRHVHKRKRVHAFNEDQEAKIRTLYEQFKDQKRCSFLIAKALDVNGKYTSAQVSHKLKELGLSVPQKKSFADNMQLTDVDDDSDDETLLSLMTRNKKENKKFSEELSEQVHEEQLPKDDDDDEILSSVLKKSRRSLLRSKNEKLKAISFQVTTKDRDFVNEANEDIMERDVGNSTSGSEYVRINNVAFKDAGLDGGEEDEATGTGSENLLGVPISYSEYKNLDDELQDSGDEVAPSAFSESLASRRKLRMIIDPEDDD
ncbi:Timeless protein [Quillaja saponaria]|uniref:Timeless protein n=1 Tax=Quillaja saponaria TaxID=32244 RepID=A0AAD7VFU1_QUISA|nr:Timeless protein [Quillaja saponaria]